jgi:hypothetical protein
MTSRVAAVLLTAGLAARPAGLPAQAIPFSQAGRVGQTIAFTDLDITYNRPTARGRRLFPDVVAWGRIWNPGADSATWLRASRDIMVEDRPLAAGDYSLWLIPRATGSWTLILSRAAHVFHTPYPGEEHDALRVELRPERGTHMETLAFYFPVVARDSAVLRMHWGETVLPIRIRAPASRR